MEHSGFAPVSECECEDQMSVVERVPDVHPSGGRKMTKQSMAAETDINAIVKRHIAFRMPLPEGPPSYGDFTGFGDFHAAQNQVVEAREQFLALPAHIRDYCENDPGKFLDLVFDPARRAELVKLGLLPEQVPAAAPAGDPPIPADPPA